jgi:hypothetical protein
MSLQISQGFTQQTYKGPNVDLTVKPGLVTTSIDGQDHGDVHLKETPTLTGKHLVGTDQGKSTDVTESNDLLGRQHVDGTVRGEELHQTSSTDLLGRVHIQGNNVDLVESQDLMGKTHIDGTDHGKPTHLTDYTDFVGHEHLSGVDCGKQMDLLRKTSFFGNSQTVSGTFQGDKVNLTTSTGLTKIQTDDPPHSPLESSARFLPTIRNWFQPHPGTEDFLLPQLPKSSSSDDDDSDSKKSKKK